MGVHCYKASSWSDIFISTCACSHLTPFHLEYRNDSNEEMKVVMAAEYTLCAANISVTVYVVLGYCTTYQCDLYQKRTEKINQDVRHHLGAHIRPFL